MYPKISIIVPVYKVEQYIHECVNSILAQSFKDFELILIDDGSPDRSGKICDEYALKDSRVKVIHKKNGGPSTARNLGIKMAKGIYLGFVDSDDMLNKYMYEKMYNEAILNNADIVACGFTEINHFTGATRESLAPFGDEITIERNEIKKKLENYLSKNKILGYACMWNKLYKRSYIQENNLLVNENLKIGEDLCFNLKALYSATKISAVSESLYTYRRINSESIMIKKEEGFNLILAARQEFLRTLKEIKISNDVYKKCLQYENFQNVSGYIELIKDVINSKKKIFNKFREITRIISEPAFLTSLYNFDNKYMVLKAKVIVFILKRVVFIKNMRKDKKSILTRYYK